MKTGSMIAVYFIIWWVCLFAVLPWGAKSHHEAGDSVSSGHAPSAPIQARMGMKVLATTVVASAVFAAFYWTITRSGLSLDDIWFLPDYRPKL